MTARFQAIRDDLDRPFAHFHHLDLDLEPSVGARLHWTACDTPPFARRARHIDLRERVQAVRRSLIHASTDDIVVEPVQPRVHEVVACAGRE